MKSRRYCALCPAGVLLQDVCSLYHNYVLSVQEHTNSRIVHSIQICQQLKEHNIMSCRCPLLSKLQ